MKLHQRFDHDNKPGVRTLRIVGRTSGPDGTTNYFMNKVMCKGEMATEKDAKRISSLFGAIGKIWTADEKYFDAVTGLSGSGPAYVFLAIEALADGGVAAGLPRDLALGLASQTVLGAASMVTNTGKHPGQLKDAVTSPAGTTIAGIHELEKGGFRGTLMSAVTAASKRCFKTVQRTFSNVVLPSFVIIWTSFMEGIFSVPPWLEIDNAAFDTS